MSVFDLTLMARASKNCNAKMRKIGLITHHHHQWLYSPRKDLRRLTREV
jgi:molybdopterin-guanine dinucleotide biosynthesis protein